MSDDTNYKKMEDAIARGIARGIREVVHKGLYIDNKQVTLEPSPPPRRLIPSDRRPVDPE